MNCIERLNKISNTTANLQVRLANLEAEVELMNSSISQKREEISITQSEINKNEEILSIVSDAVREEVEKRDEIFQESLGSLHLTFKTGAITEADFLTCYESANIGVPEGLEMPEKEQEEA